MRDEDARCSAVSAARCVTLSHGQAQAVSIPATWRPAPKDKIQHKLSKYLPLAGQLLKINIA